MNLARVVDALAADALFAILSRCNPEKSADMACGLMNRLLQLGILMQKPDVICRSVLRSMCGFLIMSLPQRRA